MMEKKNRIYVDIHVIQTVPPSCINRDDTGSPKTAVYGGVQRARVSSQSWKKAMRDMFKDRFNEEELGVRTKNVTRMISREILNIDGNIPTEEADSVANLLVKDYCEVQVDEKKGELKALFFIGVKQAMNLAAFAVENREFFNKSEKDMSKEEAKEYKKEVQKKKTAIKELISKHNCVDIALFGRMVADNPLLNSDACSQIAHSISTHRVDNEYDYFTALDDMAEEGTAGAAMIDVTEFNSATLYRYATVAVHELYRELGGEAEITVKAVNEFIKAFVTSMPTGKQNSFANRTLPEAVLVTLRTDQPINLVGAFERPVKAGDNGYSQSSVDRLAKYANKVYDDYGAAPAMAWAIGFEGHGEKTNMATLYASMEENLQKYFAVMAQE